MKSPRITFKIISGYLLLALVSFLAAFTIYNEIEKLTALEDTNHNDRKKVMQISKILTLMNETESAGKIAIRTDDQEALQFFLDKNCALQDSIIKFKKHLTNRENLQILDSVQFLLNLKSENLQELKIIQSNDSSSIKIRNAIEKLSVLEPSLGYFLLNDNVITKTRKKMAQASTASTQNVSSIVDKYKNIKIPPTRSQQKFDKTVLEVLDLLNKVNEETEIYKSQQSEKIQTLWYNDTRMSEKLNHLLSNIEKNILNNSQDLIAKRQIVFENSKFFLIIAYITTFVIIVFFSFLIIRDFWKIQKYRQELEIANIKNNQLIKSREQLVSMVSHDLRTPLSSIVGYSELLAQQNIGEKSKNYLSHIRYASEYVSKLVDELLDYSRIEAGKINIEKAPIHIEKLVKEVAESVYSVHKSKPVDLEVKVSELVQGSIFSSDSYRIKQILYNLISNAFKFTEKGKIAIDAQAKQLQGENFEITISVSDSGIGIKKEQQSRIFQEFTQANSDVSKRYGGSGLGLHISQKLAHLLKGNISLKSEENKGSTFYFTFVTERVATESITKTKNQISNKEPNEIVVFVIDDDVPVLTLINELLTQKGIKTFSFNNGKEALLKMENTDFDLVITDIQLPEMNGFHFVTLFNEKYKANPIPVLAITGRKDVPESFYVESGFSAVLPKPFSPIDFYQKIKMFFPKLVVELSNNKESNLDAHYDTKALEQFMGDDTAGIIAIYKSFVQETTENISKMKNYADVKDYESIRALAHKMLTMFGQIKATRETNILRELNTISNQDSLEVRTKINQLEKLFNQECRVAIELYCKNG